MQVENSENRDMCDWVQSVLVFSRAHNLKVVGSDPTPQPTKFNNLVSYRGGFIVLKKLIQELEYHWYLITD